MVHNLAAFVAEIQGETLVRITGPDYALLNQVARTIDQLLGTPLDGLDDHRFHGPEAPYCRHERRKY